jgi:hypothetical protein
MYSVVAHNTAADSENKIHDDHVAAQYGFRGGLVPGVTVYGYMTAPVVQHFGETWLARGAMEVRFLQPVYEGQEVVVNAEEDASGVLKLTAGPCATATAWIPVPSPLPAIPSRPLQPEQEASRETLIPGTVLGTLIDPVPLHDDQYLDRIAERLPVYRGPNAAAHPARLLQIANEILVRNYRLGPWIHVASEIVNSGIARPGDQIEARARILNRFDRAGHEFVVLDVAISAAQRPIQRITHTAIYNPRLLCGAG